ncbi:TolC family protein [Namhaeicola litoreus]|uniref:TolC family protein n=1 Tax=Namhaeicola litoreus TaxID=1052145 RepID=A0ABW3Y616_9FLAO
MKKSSDMKFSLVFVFFILSQFVYSQENSLSVLSLEEYLGYVKSFHPIVRQVNLVVDESEAKLMKARGAFDPKLEVDYLTKEFKGSEYYDKLNATFKIPTWYGIELKGNFEENAGAYLNPESFTPDDGLYSVGVSVSLAQNLWINKRMATLKQAKLFEKQALQDQQLMVNQVLYDAALVYFDWLKAYNEKLVFEDFYQNAVIRLNGVKRNFETGENPAIDTLEAGITVKDRALNLEKSKLAYTKASFELSNFLWLSDDLPIEVREDITPDLLTTEKIDLALNLSELIADDELIDNHPKIRSLNYKYESLRVDKNLKVNRLFPIVNVDYNFLSETYDQINSFNENNYKAGFYVSFPLFIRKERGDLKLAKLKLQSAELDIMNTEVTLKNKIQMIQREIESYAIQDNITQTMIVDYEALFRAEERKFDIGESSLFLVNSRESKLIDAKLKGIAILNQYYITKAKLYNALGNSI